MVQNLSTPTLQKPNQTSARNLIPEHWSLGAGNESCTPAREGMSDGAAARRWGKCGPPCSRESIMVAFKGVWTQAFWKAVTAEFLAMLIFVLLSVGSTINWGGSENPLPVDMVLISLCFGLSIATMVQCFGHISGGHINPAVTVAMVCTRKISIAKSVFYITAQCLGAIIGAGILYLVTPPSVVGGLGVTTVHGNLTAGHGLLVELIITFQLVFTIFASCDSKRTDVTGSVALAIGFSVAIGHLFAINYTGASMNPARSFGPAVIMGNWENHWGVEKVQQRPAATDLIVFCSRSSLTVEFSKRQICLTEYSRIFMGFPCRINLNHKCMLNITA
ncbi:aquaporin-4 isoform X7 [Rattus norvegicus]|uniref:aquaporin-4 isoform X7 n=1 Tax=Rattus norvegicus TaxID=10116 RepID=UPI0003D0EF29|nr:aquaporin-4 isoform X2 [Rattus norvegicus]